MNVTVKPFGNLRRLLPPGQEELALTLPPEATVDTVIRQLGMADGEVGLSVRNGELVDEDALLRDGDRLELFSVMAGGGD